MPPGTYRNITGNWRWRSAWSPASNCPAGQLFLGSYPITPASDILHELSKYKRFGVVTIQAEDEIAAIGAAIGAAFGGATGGHDHVRPGVSLKSEAIGLAVMLELPLIIIDVQRGGPSTGLPTKTEQADLLQALYGRNGEARCPCSRRSPRGLLRHRDRGGPDRDHLLTPVILLSDGYLANGSEPWRLPDIASLPAIDPKFTTEPNGRRQGRTGLLPYQRDPKTLARAWAIPGTPGLEHRIGGLEKEDRHRQRVVRPGEPRPMVRTRQAKIDGIARTIPPVEVDDPTGKAKVLVLGWGSTYGPIGACTTRSGKGGWPIAQAHLRHLNPFPETWARC